VTRASAWLALACLSTLATSACATLPPCPARGGPAWTEWTSAHFVLMTDLDEADARSALRDFEELRAAVLLAAWRRSPEPRGRLAVVAFRSDSERRVFVRPGFVAAFIATKAQQGFIVKSGAERNEIVTHGLVLALAYHYGLEGKAHWFDEGLARYLDSLRLEPDGTPTYGDVDDVIFRNVSRGLLASFENLWEPVTPATRQSFIVTSWLAVHYLFNNEPERFLDFQRRLVLTSDARAAWRAAFPELTAGAMDERLAAYAFRDGTFTAFKTRLPTVQVEAQATLLADAQVHALRALLFATMQAPRADLARAEIAEAFRLDPTLVATAYVQRAFLGDDETDIGLPKRLIARHPTSPMAWLLLARARTLRHETEEANEAWEEVRRFGGTPDGPVAVELRVARPD
jgi:hypothetical protein